MTYTLLGTGNMAWLIASRMRDAGHTCTGVWGRSSGTVDELCATFSLPKLDPKNLYSEGPDACIVAVSDSSIAEVVQAFSLRRTTLIHTAGSVSIDVASAHSMNAGVVWPVYSIRKSALPAHRDFPVLIEANSQDAWTAVRTVAKAISDNSYEASGEQRKWLHLAAVIGNNFVNHLLGVATDICKAHEIPASLLQPLLEQTVDGAGMQHPALLQTGPARRHDNVTMERHISLLSENPEWAVLYNTLSQAIMERFPMPAKG